MTDNIRSGVGAFYVQYFSRLYFDVHGIIVNNDLIYVHVTYVTAFIFMLLLYLIVLAHVTIINPSLSLSLSHTHACTHTHLRW